MTASQQPFDGLFLLMQQSGREDLRRSRQRQKMGNFLPALIILGLASAVLIYLLTMEKMGWQTPRIPKDPNAVPLLVGGGGQIGGRITLYVSPNTEAYFKKIGGNYEVLVKPWKDYFASRDLDVKAIQELSTLSSLNNGTLVLPSALALDEGERAAIRRFREQGGAVLATWATGSRTGLGDWAGWDFLGSLGSKVVGEIPPEPVAGHLILNGESPVSHTHPAGLRIWLGKPAERHLRLQTQDEYAQVAGRIMNWARIPLQERYKDAAVIFSEPPDKGRSVVLGFAESAWEASGINIHTLLDNALNWLGRKPAMVYAKWPAGMRSAQLIEMDTEEGFSNALSLAALMNAARLKGSFYVLSSEAKNHPEILKSLSRDFEIGLHGDIHVGFKGQSAEEQQKRIERMVGDLSTVYPNIANTKGFRAPTESYDQATEKLLSQNGFGYHVADPSRSEARLPFFVRENKLPNTNPLVILPRTQRDDINIDQEASSVAQWEEFLEIDAELSHDMGALGLLSVHSQNFGATHPLTNAIPKLLSSLSKRTDIWIETGDQIASWWRERERFKVSIKQVGVRLEFDISVVGDKPLKGGTLMVMLPTRHGKVIIEGTKARMPTPSVKSVDAFRTAIVFDELSPGSYQYQVLFNK